MNRKGDLSNSYAPIIAINFDTIFSRKPSIKEYLTKSKLDRMFVKEYKELTYKLYHKGFNVYIVSFKPIKDLNDTLRIMKVLWRLREKIYQKMILL